MTLVLLVRHGLTAGTGKVLTGRAPGVALDDRGRAQARAVASRLAGVPLDAILTSPLQRCRETAEIVAAARGGEFPPVLQEERLAEVSYGDWTGQPLKRLAKDPMWRVVQDHLSAVRFPGEDGEAMPDVQHRAVGAIREWNARLGSDAVYLLCSHGDVIKSVIADSLGLHLDLCQRIQVDPCSLTAIRYTPLRPFLVRMNDVGGGVVGLVRPRAQDGGQAAARPPLARSAAGGEGDEMRATAPARSRLAEGDAVIGGGAGG